MFIRTVRTAQPQGPCRIDPGNAAAKYLSAARVWIPNLGDINALSMGGRFTNAQGVLGQAYYQPSGDQSFAQLDAGSAFIPATGFSLVVVMQYGSTLGSGQAIGPRVISGIFERANPYLGSSGAVNFDFGGATEGSTRCSAAVSTSPGTVANYVFTTGPRGMEVWNKGVLLASNSANPTRTLTSVAFAAGDCYGGNGGDAEYFLVAAIPAQLDKDTAKNLSANPWQIIQPTPRALWMPGSVAGGAAVNLAAAAAAQASATAAMLHGVSLAGAALSVASATAGLTHGVPLAGAAAGQAAATASISHSVPLAATATGQVTSTGQVALTINFAANAVATALATAGLSLAKPLAAAGAGQATGGAALDVTAGGSAVNLAAAAAGQASSGATLALAVSLSAAALAQASALASFGGSAALAAQAIANAQASAALAVGKRLAGAAQGQASAGAVLWLQVPLGAAALAQAAAGGSLKLQVNLSAAALGQAGASANLPMAVALTANGVAVAGATATLQIGALNLVNTPGYVAHCIARRWSAKATPRVYVARAKVRSV